MPEDDVPDPERSTLSLALSAVALRAQAQYHSLGAAIETDLGAARRAEEAAFEADRAVTEARKRFASEVAAFLDRFNVVRAAVLARLLEASAEHAERRRRAAHVLDDRGSIGYGAACFPRVAVEALAAAGRGTKGGGGDRMPLAGTG